MWDRFVSLQPETSTMSERGGQKLAFLAGAVGLAGLFTVWTVRRRRQQSEKFWRTDSVQNLTGSGGYNVVILAAGFGARFQSDLLSDTSGQYAHLIGTPKALIEMGDHKLIEHWMESFRSLPFDIRQVFVVTNDVMLPSFKEWARSSSFPENNIISDGSTSKGDRLGAVGDLHYAIKSKAREILQRDLIVVAGDTVVHGLDLQDFLRRCPPGKVTLTYYNTNDEEIERRGILELGWRGRVTSFLEKPNLQDTDSRKACPALYVFRRHTIPLIGEFVGFASTSPLYKRDAPGHMMKWLINKTDVRAIPIEGHFKIDSLNEYKLALDRFSPALEVYERAHARVGLLGNPSDGYYGKTVAISVEDFFAEVTIRQSRILTIVPHSTYDREAFKSMDELADHTMLAGYYGGIRLIRATIKRFCELCRDADVPRPPPFTISYQSNIPFACGMSGSSAIITACFKALLRFAGLSIRDLKITKAQLPSVILSVEKDELGINAGLQDRVIQVYEGAVFMDFDRKHMEIHGHGRYEPIPTSSLPPMYLAYQMTPGGDSGKLHSNVKKRWLDGEEEVHMAMQTFGSFAARGSKAIANGNHRELAECMDSNFQLRRKIFTEAALGDTMLRMVALANKNNFSAKFTGSGGAIIMLYRGDGNNTKVGSKLSRSQEDRLIRTFNAQGFHLRPVNIHNPTNSDLFEEN